jgi:cbb3-type cytochrome oxidase subunit 3
MAGQAVLAADSPGATNALNGLSTTANSGGLNTNTDLQTTIGKTVGAILAFIGIAFFILVIYGGYLWMFSMGNEQTVAKAKQIIIAAFIGLVIVLMAYAITAYIGSQFTTIY